MSGYALVEVRGGVADFDFKDTTGFMIDWDNVGDSYTDAAETLDRLADVWPGLPVGDFVRIRDTLIEVWPELREKWEELRSQWTPGLQQREASL